MNLTEAEYAALLARGTVHEVGQACTSQASPAASERDFLARILKLAHVCGYLAYHTHDSRKSAPGFPDLVFVQPPSAQRPHGRLLFAELKTQRGKLTTEQAQWMQVLQTVPGIECYVWRPAQWNELVAILTTGG